jgi:hypothetical protein
MFWTLPGRGGSIGVAGSALDLAVFRQIDHDLVVCERLPGPDVVLSD